MHRLALALHRTVTELENTMTLRELRDWEIFEATVEPLPDKLADLQNGVLCSTVVNLVRSADSTPAVASDYFTIRDTVVEPEVEAVDDRSESRRMRDAYYGGR